MRRIRFAVILLASISVLGCASLSKDTSPPKLVPVSEVLNTVKDELNAYLATPPKAQAKTGVCGGKDGEVAIKVVPAKVTVTLRTVSAHQSEPSAGLTVPIGVLSLDPSFSGGYSQTRTQALVLSLDIAPKGKPQKVALGEHPIANAIAEFRDELIKVDHDKTPCFEPKELVKLTVAFDVVNKSTGGFTLKLVVFKLGDKETMTDEAHQTLDVYFSLVGTQFFIQ